MSDLTDEQWATIDSNIFANDKLSALKALRTHCGNLPDAIRQLYARYELLRANHPDRFAVSDDEYWRGCDS